MALTITKPSEPLLSRSRQQFEVLSSGHGALDRYRVVCSIPNGDLPNIEISQTPDGDGKTYFELSECLDSQLGVFMPPDVLTLLAKTNEPADELTVDFVEKWYDGNGFPLSATTSETFNAIRAGLGHQRQALDFVGTFGAGTKFLSYTGRGIATPKNGAQYLGWYSHVDDTRTIGVSVTLHYADGSTSTYEATTFSMTPTDWMAVIAVGHDQLDIDTNATGEVVSWDVTLTEAGFAVETFSLALDGRDAKKQFAFQNSCGGLSVLHCFGEWEEKSSLQRKMVERNVPIGNAANFAQFGERNVRQQGEGKASTGYYRRGSEMAAHVKECLMSRHVYEIRNGAMVPVVLKTATQAFDQSLPELLAVHIEYVDAFANYVYDEAL